MATAKMPVKSKRSFNTEVHVFSVRCPQCSRVHWLTGKASERQDSQIVCDMFARHFFLVKDAELLAQEKLPELPKTETKDEALVPATATA